MSRTNKLCADLSDPEKVAGCEIGKPLLETGKVGFAGQDVLCIRGGQVTGAVVDVNEVIVINDNNNDDAILLGASIGGSLAAVGLLALGFTRYT